MGTGGPFPGGKACPGRDADHSPPSSSEVKNEQELSLLSSPPPCASIACSGITSLYFTFCAKKSVRRILLSDSSIEPDITGCETFIVTLFRHSLHSTVLIDLSLGAATVCEGRMSQHEKL
jgi:hypothetical protein